MTNITKSPRVPVPQHAVEALIGVFDKNTPVASREQVSRDMLQHAVLMLEGLGATVTWAEFMSSADKED